MTKKDQQVLNVYRFSSLTSPPHDTNLNDFLRGYGRLLLRTTARPEPAALPGLHLNQLPEMEPLNDGEPLLKSLQRQLDVEIISFVGSTEDLPSISTLRLSEGKSYQMLQVRGFIL